MVQRLVRIMMNMAVSKGIDAASQGGKDPQDMTADDRRIAQSKRKNLGRVRQAANMLRRFMR